MRTVMTAIVAIIMLSIGASQGVAGASTETCQKADKLMTDGDYSQSIQSINICLSERDLSSTARACLLLKRARAYFEMGQDDKSGGDVGSALEANPELSNPELAASCVGTEKSKAEALLATAN